MSSPVIKHITNIPDETIHKNSTLRKRLVWVDEHHKGDIATINYARLKPKSQLDIHRHKDGEEFYYFLNGSGHILVDDVWLTVTPGDFVTIPMDTNHSVKNDSDSFLIFLTIRTVQPTL